MRDTPHISKRVHRDIGYFSLTWSALEPVSRRRINAAVPSLPGIWEVYYLENSRVPRLIKMGAAWRGGVRHKLRFETDPGQPANSDVRSYLESGDSYYRYTICETRDDLVDAYVVVASIRGWDIGSVEATGRFLEVRVREPDEMMIKRIRTPSETPTPPTPYGSTVPNMFDVMRELDALKDDRGDSDA